MAQTASGVERVAVLASGGLDSSVLLAELAQESQVFPLYVREGLAWEPAELGALKRYLAALGSPQVQPLSVLSIPVEEIYGLHWSVTGEDVPGADEPDANVFIPGRNVLLLGLTAVWCSTHDIPAIAIGSLGGNPFPDATMEFFQRFSALLSDALVHPISILAPYRGMLKEDLVRQNSSLPLHLTLTCMAPRGGTHCGRCNKCAERRAAFAAAGVEDRSRYFG